MLTRALVMAENALASRRVSVVNGIAVVALTVSTPKFLQMTLSHIKFLLRCKTETGVWMY